VSTPQSEPTDTSTYFGMRRIRTMAPALGLLLALQAAATAGDAVCVPPSLNTLTTSCFDACESAADYPLCISYAPASAQNESSQAGQGDYYYLGCAFTDMDTCMVNVTAGNCELQCLQTNNVDALAWVLNVAQPQEDRADTGLFQYIDALELPPTLKNLYAACWL
jgi:hypothetical protein